jgi:hypothetical protein
MKNLNGHRIETRDLPAWSILPQPTAPPPSSSQAGSFSTKMNDLRHAPKFSRLLPRLFFVVVKEGKNYGDSTTTA